MYPPTILFPNATECNPVTGEPLKRWSEEAYSHTDSFLAAAMQATSTRKHQPAGLQDHSSQSTIDV